MGCVLGGTRAPTAGNLWAAAGQTTPGNHWPQASTASPLLRQPSRTVGRAGGSRTGGSRRSASMSTDRGNRSRHRPPDGGPLGRPRRPRLERPSRGTTPISLAGRSSPQRRVASGRADATSALAEAHLRRRSGMDVGGTERTPQGVSHAQVSPAQAGESTAATPRKECGAGQAARTTGLLEALGKVSQRPRQRKERPGRPARRAQGQEGQTDQHQQGRQLASHPGTPAPGPRRARRPWRGRVNPRRLTGPGLCGVRGDLRLSAWPDIVGNVDYPQVGRRPPVPHARH